MTAVHSFLTRLRLRLADESGVTMIVAIGVFAVSVGLIVASITAANSEVHLTQNDIDQKKAYAAAQAGLEHYVFELQQNVNYWTLCKSQTTPTVVPGASSDEEYTYEPIVASSIPSTDHGVCSTTDPIGSMVESGSGPNPAAAGTFRIEFNGYAVDKYSPLNNGLIERTIMATFRRGGFLNYIYYTEYETDPAGEYPPATDCAAPYGSRGNDCPLIEFITGDDIQGPMHSEDTIQTCGSPVFGRPGHVPADVAEAKGAQDQGCGGSPTYNTANGHLNTNAPTVLPPPDNSQLKQIATTQFTGPTQIVFNGSMMTVTNANISGGVETVAIPNGNVIYVSNSSCGVTYTPFISPDATSSGCGDVEVSGNYTSSVTVAADNDIIINGSLTTDLNSSALLGLVANDYVRVYHPLTNSRNAGDDCNNNSNGSGSTSNIVIDAAILAVQKSFEVDNYDCGSPLGTLTINGALAQVFRGTVGTHKNGTLVSGYTKSYIYDDRLLAEEPPYFLNPINAAWQVSRETECSASGVASACTD